MAEEEQEQQPKDGKDGKGAGALIRMGIVAFVVLGAAVGGFVTFQFVLAPMLADEDGGEEAEPKTTIPLNPVTIAFDDSFVNVMREDEAPASTLVYGVTLECNNQMTADVVEAYLPRFVDMIGKLHDSRTRSELDDVLSLKESIQRQALQKCNAMLKKMQDDPDPAIRITAVFHHTFAVQDL